MDVSLKFISNSFYKTKCGEFQEKKSVIPLYLLLILD